MEFPNPIIERERIKSSEGFAQYILATLIMGGRPPGYNKPVGPSSEGRKLLKALWKRSFGGELTDNISTFVWEYSLPSLSEEDPNRWPDLAAISESRLIIFELKTLSGSIREGQVDEQIKLARHNFPEKFVNMIYITADPVEGAPSLDEHSGYSNILWTDVAECLENVWSNAGSESGGFLASQYVDYLRTRYSNLSAPISTPKVIQPKGQSTEKSDQTTEPSLSRAIIEVLKVESSTDSSALEFPGESPQEAARYRDEIAAFIKAYNEVAPTPVLHVIPWVWTPVSLGEAKTEQGSRCGVEVRLSYYEKPIHCT